MKALELAHQDGRHFKIFLCFSLFTLLLGYVDFRASDGWLQKFLQRQHFSLRRKTTVSQRLPQDLVPKVTEFIMYTRKLRHHKGYLLSHIGNMDETPLCFDMPGETTITRTGERSVPICTTGHDKGRLTVFLSAMADGTKLKPFVVFKGVRPVWSDCCIQQKWLDE